MFRVLTIAGSDSGGGAGIEADVKTISALGGYAMTAITALTAQNTLGVAGVHALPPEFVKLTIETVLADLGVDAVKLGMLANEAIIRVVGAVLPACVPVVLDPVMVATSGAVLLPDGAITALRECLIPRATLITPNLPEAGKLTGLPVASEDEQIAAGRALIGMGAKAALIKGGHGSAELLTDFLVTETSVEAISLPRIATRNTHGTGCTLASAIATGLAQGMTLTDAVNRARKYLQEAIRTAPGFGAGHGPINHLVK
jgi:hydroxymethylpyrimidine/phosphomethylpyrimidine kinase